jgi:AAA family ATP:ADP antiporter
MLNLFVLLTSYYILKTTREPLILTTGGAELKSYTAAGQAILLLAVVPAYCVLVNRMDRLKLIDRLTHFFSLNLVAFFFLFRIGVPNLGVPFYLWVGIFGLMIIAQFWSLANDLYSPNQGKRLFPLVAFGSNLGAIAGSRIAGGLLSAGLEPYEMMIIASILVGLSTLITRRAVACSGTCPAGAACADPSSSGLSRNSFTSTGFGLLVRDHYLVLIAALMLLTNLVNTTGEYILSRTVLAAADANLVGESEIARQQFIGSFYASFFSWVNIAGALLQLLAVSRILKYAGVRGALLVLPLIALGGYALIAASSALLTVRVTKILENATDYSLQNTTRHALFLPTSTEAKYKAKQAIDTFFVRVGDVGAAGIVLLGTMLDFTTRGFALLNAGLVVIWLALAVAIGRRYHALAHAWPARNPTRGTA